jgi:hypothetical protein
MKDSRKIIVIQSNSSALEDNQLFWLFSKNQLELVLKEIDPAMVEPASDYCQATITWQDEILPVVSLEKYFGIAAIHQATPTKYILLKGAQKGKQEVHVAMIAVPIFSDLKIGSVNFSGTSISPTVLKANETDILGAYEHRDRKIIVPDIYRIACRTRLVLKDQGK